MVLEQGRTVVRSYGCLRKGRTVNETRRTVVKRGSYGSVEKVVQWCQDRSYGGGQDRSYGGAKTGRTIV